MKKRHSGILLFLIISLGLILRFVQYFYNRGMWMDEASLALNIIDPTISLFKPLENLQVAPILFLLIERLSFYLFGASELSLRLFPFICSIVTIPFAYLFFKNIAPNKVIVFIALCIFCLAPSLIYYSSEVKQYAVDVLITLVLFYLSTSSLDDKRKNLWLLFVGGVGIFLSNITPFLFVVIGGYTLYTQILRRKTDYWFYVVGVVWSLLFAGYYMFFIHDHSTREFMQSFWAPNFMPLNPFSQEFFNFVVKKIGYSIKMIFVYNSVNNVYLLGMITLMFLLGFWKLLKRKEFIPIYFIFFPIAFHLLISFLKIYPYHLRLVLYLTPFYILIFSYGLFSVYDIFQKKISEILAIIIVGVVFSAMFFENIKLFPFERFENRNALKYVYDNQKPGEQFYVHWDFDSCLKYYIKAGILPFNSEGIIHGSIETSSENYLNKMETLKGDIWFVTSDIQDIGSECILEYLQHNAELLDSYHDFKAHALLYRIE